MVKQAFSLDFDFETWIRNFTFCCGYVGGIFSFIYFSILMYEHWPSIIVILNIIDNINPNKIAHARSSLLGVKLQIPPYLLDLN